MTKTLTFDYSKFNGFAVTSYSQEGEDIILRRIFEGQKTGFYVDVGAHHPIRFSNTYYFYQQGWKGINIDPSPNVMEIFRKKRDRDINLEMGVSDRCGQKELFVFNEPALNSFNREYVDDILATSDFRLLGSTLVPVDTLENILASHLGGESIDFLNVDAEEHDLEVLRANDWERFRPRYILVECLDTQLDQVEGCRVHRFLTKNGYRPLAKTFNTLIFQDATE